MTEREKFDAEEQKREIISAHGGICQYPGCYLPARDLAHRIGKGNEFIEKYGCEVVHHRLNMVPVCGKQSHNDYFNIGHNPVKTARLVARIRRKISIESGIA